MYNCFFSYTYVVFTVDPLSIDVKTLIIKIEIKNNTNHKMNAKNDPVQLLFVK